MSAVVARRLCGSGVLGAVIVAALMAGCANVRTPGVVPGSELKDRVTASD